MPLLNIVDVTLKAIPSNAKKTAILGTRPTIDSQIFQKGLTRMGLPYALNAEWQEKIDKIILTIKAGTDETLLIPLWKELSNDLLLVKIDTILVVCTDLNVLFKKANVSFQIVDSSLCLAKAIVHQWQKMISTSTSTLSS